MKPRTVPAEPDVLESAPDGVPEGGVAVRGEVRGVGGVVLHAGDEDNDIDDGEADQQHNGHVGLGYAIDLAAEDGDEHEGGAGDKDADDIGHAVGLEHCGASGDGAGGRQDEQAPDLQLEEDGADGLYGLVGLHCPVAVAVGLVELRGYEHLAPGKADKDHCEDADDDAHSAVLAIEVPGLVTGGKAAADVGAKPYGPYTEGQAPADLFRGVNDKQPLSTF